jgi:predicted transcriptional regulator
MAAPRESQPRTRRYSVRYHDRLYAETWAKLQELAAAFHRKRSAILRHVMQWGLTQTRGWTIDMTVPGTVRTVGMLLEPELLQRVQEAAAVHGATVAAWLRQAMRQVTPEDFPGSWQAENIQGRRPRSHDSRQYRTRFMLRLDDETSEKLDTLTQTFDCSAAEVLRHLIAQATPQDFPQSWRLAAAAHRPPDARPADRGTP